MILVFKISLNNKKFSITLLNIVGILVLTFEIIYRLCLQKKITLKNIKFYQLLILNNYFFRYSLKVNALIFLQSLFFIILSHFSLQTEISLSIGVFFFT